MTRLSRRPWVIATGAFLFSSYLKLALGTTRWRREGQDSADQVWSAGGGAVLCFWHGRISLSPASWPQGGGRQAMHALISRSGDGEFIAQTVGRLGFPSVRGSRDPKRKGEAEKGGAAALRDMLRLLRAGEAVAVTPDGPSGPAEVMGEGPVLLSRMGGGAPVLLAGLAVRPCLRLRSWDQAVFPLPFGRGAIVYDGPVRAPRDLDASGVEALRREWTARLVAATEGAEAMLKR